MELGGGGRGGGSSTGSGGGACAGVSHRCISALSFLRFCCCSSLQHCASGRRLNARRCEKGLPLQQLADNRLQAVCGPSTCAPEQSQWLSWGSIWEATGGQPRQWAATSAAPVPVGPRPNSCSNSSCPSTCMHRGYTPPQLHMISKSRSK